ncbi:MAG: hypothetical protein WDO18_19035 [Acidobacteriota bacterium]
MDTTLPPQASAAIMIDSAYFAMWAWIAPEGWQAAFAGAYLLASATLILDWARSTLTAAVALVLTLITAGFGRLALTMFSMSVSPAPFPSSAATSKGRMSSTLRQT